jgi:phosphoglycerol transferase
MLISGIALISARKFEKISPFFWLTTGLILFSLAGGINYLLGALGFLLLRATDRSSILISCMALYFLCEKSQPSLCSRWGWVIASFLIGVGIWDQLPRYPTWEEATRQQAWRDFKSDQNFFGTLEKELPTGAMVFELPVKDYPEMGPVNEMGDYEHFRPVLHTRELRFSYGTVKGRGDNDWQKRVSSETPPEVIRDLERYGFSAILINRKAYKDRGNTLERDLCAAGAALQEMNQDFVILKIQPSESPEQPSKI